jgi:hypothetical protein
MAQMSADILYNPIYDDQLEEEPLERTPSSVLYSDGSTSGKNSRTTSLVRYSDGSISESYTQNVGSLSISPPEISKKEKITRYAFYSIFTSIVVLAFYIAVAAIYHSYVYMNYNPAPYVYNYNPSLGSDVVGAEPAGTIFAASQAAGFGTAENPITVTLIGDSMIGKAWQFRNLNGKLLERLAKHTDLHIRFINHGQNGATISNIGARIVSNVVTDQSSIVIINWDSDATDSDTIDMTTAQYDQFKVQYVKTLDWALANVTALPQVKFVAIAGPSLYGEGPVFKPSRFTPDKDKVLSQFRQLNIEAAQRFRLPYIDMRSALQSVSVSWWGLYRLWCTQDGEHYSELGASIEADNFVQFLRM